MLIFSFTCVGVSHVMGPTLISVELNCLSLLGCLVLCGSANVHGTIFVARKIDTMYHDNQLIATT